MRGFRARLWLTRGAAIKRGRILELAEKRTLFHNPQHEYTRSLLDAVPIPDPRLRRQGTRQAPG
ncbi:ABC transporter ATP-binding protein [Nitratireductor sp. CH_MIT9313-5]|uniref:ABC transporter ATP-binding protein n=1 Tax=Nitratireductor sp. CH_MIT9313-5 TaxID=3107764 RepID=UPI00300A0982